MDWVVLVDVVVMTLIENIVNFIFFDAPLHFFKLTMSFLGSIGVIPVFFRLGGGIGNIFSPFGGKGGLKSDWITIVFRICVFRFGWRWNMSSQDAQNSC